MKLVIFSEAGFEYGFGHFYRMSGICEKAERENGKAEMHLTADETARENLERSYVRYTDWHDPANYKKILDDETTLVIDSYHTELAELETFQSLARDMIVIDDNIRLRYHDMKILNPNYFGMWLDYPKDRNNTLYAGKDCTLLRDEFVPEDDRTAPEIVSDILITMGGTDPKGLTGGLIRKIRSISAEAALHVVCTGAYRNLDEIKGSLSSGDRLYMNAGAAEVRDLMKNCDCAVASAGGTTNELIKMQCPSVLVVAADNQVLNTGYLTENGFVLSAKEGDMAAIGEIFSAERRASMIEKMKEFRSDRSGKDIICEIAFGRK